MQRDFSIAAVALSALAACASAPDRALPRVPVAMSPAPRGAPGEDQGPVGEVTWLDLGQAESPRRASFDGWIVNGPPVRLGRTPDGHWAGTVNGRDGVLDANSGRLAAAAVDIGVERQGDRIWLTGTWFGSPVRIEVARDRIRGSAGANSFDLQRWAPDIYRSANGTGMLRVTGAAQSVDDAAMPQLALALLAVVAR